MRSGVKPAARGSKLTVVPSRTAAILPIKRFERAKQRLANALGAGSRSALAGAMVADVLRTLERSRAIEAVLVVSSEPAIRDIVDERRVTLLPDTSERGQSNATLTGLARAAALGYERALLVAGDTPLVEPDEIDALIERFVVDELEVAIVPDRHGAGTNALLFDPASGFEPQFGPGSLDRHVEQARRRGLHHRVEAVPSLGLDLDTGDDLAALRKELERAHGRASLTRGALRQIARSRSEPQIAA
jgi:2-phospho-L-lactate guanylyltransferase